MTPSNHSPSLTRPSRSGYQPRVPRAGWLGIGSLGRYTASL